MKEHNQVNVDHFYITEFIPLTTKVGGNCLFKILTINFVIKESPVRY